MRTRKAAFAPFDETPPAPDRLRAMIVACASSNDLDASMRAEIMRALKGIEARLTNEHFRRRGAPVSMQTLQAAALARELVTKYGVKPERCAKGAAIETLRKQFGAKITDVAVAATYGKLKRSYDNSLLTTRGDKYLLANCTDGVIDDALARLPASAKRNRANRTPQPPFAIVLAHLYDKDSEKTENK